MDKNLFPQLKFRQKFQYPPGMEVNSFVASVDSMPIHIHDGPEFILVLEGRIKLKISFNEYTLRPGDFLPVNCYELHRIERDTEANLVLFLQMEDEFTGGSLFVFDPYFYENYNLSKVREVKRLMAEIYGYSRADETKERQRAESAAAELSALCNEYFQIQQYDPNAKALAPYWDHSLYGDRIKSIYRYLYTGFSDKIRLEDVAQREHIDKFYTSRLIKDGMGANFQKTLNIVRADRAEVFILGTDLPIQAVCEEVGFSSYDYFCKQFKQHFQMSPGEYRKKYGKRIYPEREMRFEIVELSEPELLSFFNQSAEGPCADGNGETQEKALELAALLRRAGELIPSVADSQEQWMGKPGGLLVEGGRISVMTDSGKRITVILEQLE